MPIAHGFLATAADVQSPQAQAAQAAGQAAAQAGAQVTREQAAQIREQAQEMRAQAQEFKENLRNQIQAEIDAARAAQGQAPIPPIPPIPPDFGSHVGPRDDSGGIPPQAVDIVSILGMTLVFCVVGFPIARAFARWIDRRGTVVAASPDISNRLHAIEQAVESVAVEVERISEGQRFTTRVLSERTHEPAADFLARGRDGAHVGLPADSGPGAPINARRS